jgi:hypothetical protein
MDIFLPLVGILALIGVVVFLILRSGRNRGETERRDRDWHLHNDDYQQDRRNDDFRQNRRDERPVIIRRPIETNMQSGHERRDSNITSRELEAIHNRLRFLEGNVSKLFSIVEQLNAGSKLESKSILPDRSRQQDEVKNSDRGIKSAVSENASPSSSNTVRDAYHKLSTEGLRNLPIEPLFVFLDVDSSAMGSAVGESQRLFRQSDNKQNAFVIFQNNRRDGWLFPNPRISYTESMRYVFPELSHENYEGFKNEVEPKKVRMTAEEMWEMLAD